MAKKKVDLKNEIDRTMYGQGKADALDELSPTMKQFVFRFLDVRDLEMFKEFKKYLSENDELHDKIADKVYDKLAETIMPLHTTLERIDKKLDEHDKAIVELKKIHELPKDFDLRLQKVENLIPVIDDLKEYASPKWTGIRWGIFAIITILAVLVLSERFPEIIHKIFGR